jgi:hypothetical protein
MGQITTAHGETLCSRLTNCFPEDGAKGGSHMMTRGSWCPGTRWETCVVVWEDAHTKRERKKGEHLPWRVSSLWHVFISVDAGGGR